MLRQRQRCIGMKIFLSYRRDDSAATCGRIYDRLIAQFGRDIVFKDVDSIPLGVDFPTYIQSVMSQCAVLLAVIGPLWLDITGPDGQRRLENPGDTVRLEIEAALAHRIPVIPLLVQGVTMPAASQLPPRLRPLVLRNGVSVRYDPDFDGDMRRVIKALEQWVAPLPHGSAGVTVSAQYSVAAKAPAGSDLARVARQPARWPPGAVRAMFRRVLGIAALLVVVTLCVQAATTLAWVNRQDVLATILDITTAVVGLCILGVASYRTAKALRISNAGLQVAAYGGALAGFVLAIPETFVSYWGNGNSLVGSIETLMSTPTANLLATPFIVAGVGLMAGGVAGFVGGLVYDLKAPRR